MARARKIPGLDDSASFGQAAASAVQVRSEEIFSFADGVLDTSNPERVHDMRVATRRLRAALEIFADCFPKSEHRALLREVKLLADALGERGDAAAKGASEAKQIQTLLGELHDCDEMLLLIGAHTERLRGADTEAALALAPRGATDLPASTARSLPNRLHYRGLESLSAYFRA